MEAKTITVDPPSASSVGAPAAPSPIRRPRHMEPEPPPSGDSHWLRWVILLALLAGTYPAYRYGYPRLYPRLAPYVSKLLANLASSTAKPAAPTAAGQRVVPVIAATAHVGNLPIYLDGLGSVMAFNTVTVRTRVDGQIMKIGFVEGQMVHEGDELFQIDPRPFQVQLMQAEGQLAKDQAQLLNAQADLERNKIAKEAVSQQQYDTAVATVAQFQGAVKVDQAQIDDAKLQLTYCRITAPISGRIGLRAVDLGNIVHATDQAGLVVITQLQPILVVFNLPQASIPRIIGKLDSGNGLSFVARGSLPPNATTNDKQQTTNNPGQPGQPDPLVVEVYDTDLATKLATSSRLAIDSQVDPSSGTIRLKAAFDNQDNALFPNQFVNVRLLVDTRKNAIIVPSAAVQRGPQGKTFVYIVKADDTVELRNVVAGPSEGNQMAIESGLSAGEQVVTDGVDKLIQGTKVAVGGASGNRTLGSGSPNRDPGSGSRVPPSARNPEPEGTRNPNNAK